MGCFTTMITLYGSLNSGFSLMMLADLGLLINYRSHMRDRYSDGFTELCTYSTYMFPVVVDTIPCMNRDDSFPKKHP